MKKRKKESETEWYSYVLWVVQGVVLAILFCMLMLFGCAGLIAHGVIKEAWMDGTVLAVCALGTFGAGVVQKCRLGTWSPAAGLATAAMVCLVFGCMGILLWDQASLAQGKNILIACVCGGGLSGILLGKSKKKRRS